ncbi:hypothetical protein DFA_06089 [Cavenderia fasciculata]|uniref:Pesticidal crystal protein N-terminal domain-containing protein n=1 Tax=Cavenderia fasciculata TaxID=261658 RepID=F4PK27_CACFS|nr:uncharacterized protein DFA_06089 [Cavenderia fasciculata]EGG23951.1 hypothetical protein DFA_06089 [Cavenderia fasciculata]|eukprot:XP_004361802.1 hypothetical protein DFA_06089 [Cavenderia fasciculata]
MEWAIGDVEDAKPPKKLVADNGKFYEFNDDAQQVFIGVIGCIPNFGAAIQPFVGIFFKQVFGKEDPMTTLRNDLNQKIYDVYKNTAKALGDQWMLNCKLRVDEMAATFAKYNKYKMLIHDAKNGEGDLKEAKESFKNHFNITQDKLTSMLIYLSDKTHIHITCDLYLGITFLSAAFYGDINRNGLEYGLNPAEIKGTTNYRSAKERSRDVLQLTWNQLYNKNMVSQETQEKVFCYFLDLDLARYPEPPIRPTSDILTLDQRSITSYYLKYDPHHQIKNFSYDVQNFNNRIDIFSGCKGITVGYEGSVPLAFQNIGAKSVQIRFHYIGAHFLANTTMTVVKKYDGILPTIDSFTDKQLEDHVKKLKERYDIYSSYDDDLFDKMGIKKTKEQNYAKCKEYLSFPVDKSSKKTTTTTTTTTSTPVEEKKDDLGDDLDDDDMDGETSYSYVREDDDIQWPGEEEIYKQSFTRKESVGVLNTDRAKANESEAFAEDPYYGGPAHGLFTSKTFDLPNDFYGSIEFSSALGFISTGVNMRYYQNEMLKIGYVEIFVENKVNN